MNVMSRNYAMSLCDDSIYFYTSRSSAAGCSPGGMRRRSWKLEAGSHSNLGESLCMLRHITIPEARVSRLRARSLFFLRLTARRNSEYPNQHTSQGNITAP
jgi:hypothetical protein